MSNFNWKDCYVGYLNLDHRNDRFVHINEQLSKLGIPFERTRGKLPNDFDLSDPKLQVMKNRTVGACGCHYGQVEIMQKALDTNRNVMVFEDDAVLCSDIKERLDYIEDFINREEPEFDIFWLGGTVHISPSHWHIGGANSDLPDTTLTRDAVCTNDPRIVQTYGAFCTFAYIVNKNSIKKVLDLLEENVHLSMGIDWIMIKIQPQLKTFMLLPGSVKQMDNQSDIGSGWTIFSGFSRLGNYWWQDTMDSFDPTTFDFGEAAKK